jgi:hypothetical protein
MIMGFSGLRGLANQIASQQHAVDMQRQMSGLSGLSPYDLYRGNPFLDSPRVKVLGTFREQLQAEIDEWVKI